MSMLAILSHGKVCHHEKLVDRLQSMVEECKRENKMLQAESSDLSCAVNDRDATICLIEEEVQFISKAPHHPTFPHPRSERCAAYSRKVN